MRNVVDARTTSTLLVDLRASQRKFLQRSAVSQFDSGSDPEPLHFALDDRADLSSFWRRWSTVEEPSQLCSQRREFADLPVDIAKMIPR
jgi:hypothetical protein